MNAFLAGTADMNTLVNNGNAGSSLSSSLDARAALETAARLHNRALNLVRKNPDFARASQEEKYAIVRAQVQQFYPTVNLDSLIGYERFQALFKKITDLQVQDRAADFPEVLAQEGLIGARQKEMLGGLYRILFEAQDSLDVDRVVGPIEGFECSIMLRKDLTLEEKFPLLAATTIARYTTAYWIGEEPEEGVARALKLKWLFKALADLGGFIVGAIAGEIIGGPQGAVAGGTLVGTAASTIVDELVA